mmetsp:Transcript_79826/g.185365  ORF Transcript_79826/g.185365 Transcript_79826/m.185365 type:complete len:222 (+) Transcript_79826:48-713(+)
MVATSLLASDSSGEHFVKALLASGPQHCRTQFVQISSHGRPRCGFGRNFLCGPPLQEQAVVLAPSRHFHTRLTHRQCHVALVGPGESGSGDNLKISINVRLPRWMRVKHGGSTDGMQANDLSQEDKEQAQAAKQGQMAMPAEDELSKEEKLIFQASKEAAEEQEKVITGQMKPQLSKEEEAAFDRGATEGMQEAELQGMGTTQDRNASESKGPYVKAHQGG